MITLASIHNARILLVDDQLANVKLLEYMLGDAGYLSVSSTMDSRTVLDLHRANHYDLIVLDLNMPFMNGFQVLEALKEIETEGYLPVLVVTADPGHKLRALESGAKDFVSKPFDHVEVLTRIRNMLEVRLLYTETRDYGFRMAHYDSLTGLPNRALFHQTLEQAMQAPCARTIAVLLIDLDGFGQVNDSLGHVKGDAVLRQFALRLMEAVPQRIGIGRLGNDEFSLILAEREGEQDAVIVVDKIRRALAPCFNLDDDEISLTASIGIATYPADAGDAGTLITIADTALSRAKHTGRDSYRFYADAMNEQAQRRLRFEHALRAAIVNDEFELHFQPKVQISTGRISGAEALLRWNRPGHGQIPPFEFIPVLETTGLIIQVGEWVINSACAQIATSMRSDAGPMHIAVNVSSRQFADVGLEAHIVKAIADNRIAAEMLELEVTESALMDGMERTIATLANLKAMGVRVAIDDFGTGDSSLAYLKRFPVDTLKIDIAFIREVASSPDDAAIVQAIIAMAHRLNLEVIAEGVETAPQLAFLIRNRCDHIQGYYFGRPLPTKQFEQMLREDAYRWRHSAAAHPLAH